MSKIRYWNENGKFQNAADELQKLIPREGKITGSSNKALERFRKAANVYHDIYNNGLCNRARSFTVLGIGSAHNNALVHRGMYRFSDNGYVAIENAMDEIIAHAAHEQGIALYSTPVQLEMDI